MYPNRVENPKHNFTFWYRLEIILKSTKFLWKCNLFYDQLVNFIMFE